MVMAKKTGKDDISALIKRTDVANPRPEDMERIRRILDEDPNRALVRANDISRHALNRVIESVGSSALIKELYTRQTDAKRKELGYDDANAFVKMLIDQVILTNLRLNQIELLHVAKLEGAGSHSHESGLYWDKRLTAAQRRFLRACETLAKARKLLAEAERHEAHTRNIRSASTKRSLDIYRQMSGG